MLVGLLRPVVLLPERIDQHLQPCELRTVLVHEFQHVLRSDLLINLITSLFAAAYWFHPAVWVTLLQLRRLRELACDEGTVAVLSGSRKSYASGLVKVAEMISCQQPTPALGFIERKSEMKNRVMTILDSRLRVGRKLSVSAIGVIVALALILLPGAGRPALSHANSTVTNGDAESTHEPTAMARSTESKDSSAEIAVEESKPEQTSKTVSDQQDQAPNNNKENGEKQSPPSEMVVHVVDEEGQPLEGVNFYVSAGTGKLLLETFVKDNFKSGGDGIARLKFPDPLLSVRIWASKSGYMALFFNWEKGDTDSVPDEYSLILQRGTELGGVVVDTQGQPIEGASIDVSLFGGGTKIDPQERVKLTTWLANGDDAAVTDAEGRWAISNAPGGDDLQLRFQITHRDYINAKARHPMGHYRVTLEELRAKTARFELKQGTEISGRVTDDQGNPIANALVVWGDRPYSEEGSQEDLTNENGEYLVPPQPTGDVRITVVAKGWMPLDLVIAVSLNNAASEDFELAKGKKLHLAFVDETGKPVPDVFVAVEEWHGVKALYNHRHPNVKDSGIPAASDNEGNYIWDWAPDDLIKLRVVKRGTKFAKLIEAVADDEIQTIVLNKPFALSGNVLDASTGEPISNYSIVPVTYQSLSASDRGIAQPQQTRKFESATFEFDDAYYSDDGRLVAFRFQAVGYRDFTTERFAAEAPDQSVTVGLDPAPTRTVRVLNADGKPAKTAMVWIAKPDQGTMINQFMDYFSDYGGGSSPVDNNSQLQYGSPGTLHAIVAVSRDGYAEKYLQVEEEPGDLILKPWARLEGQLMQAGEPIPGASIVVRPIRQLGGDNPQVQDNFQTTTDAQGKFVFAQLPPVPVIVSSMLNSWRDFPITSNQVTPVELQPGKSHQVLLGGEGLQVVGKVRLLGDGADQIQFRYGIHTLLRLEGGIPMPDHATTRIEYEAGELKEWQDRLSEGLDEHTNRESFFVKLRDDGTFLISGVEPGKYRMLFQIYEPPSGCLVEPVGYGFLEFSTDDYTLTDQQLDLGTIDIELKPIPQVGESLPDFRYNDSSGQQHRISEWRGKHVMIDFWASWCQPCIKAFPDLAGVHKSIADEDRAAIVSISVDEDIDAARTIVKREKLEWSVGFAGDISGEESSSARSLGISTVPTYLVLDPEGKILYRGFSHEEAATALKDAIE